MARTDGAILFFGIRAYCTGIVEVQCASEEMGRHLAGIVPSEITHHPLALHSPGAIASVPLDLQTTRWARVRRSRRAQAQTNPRWKTGWGRVRRRAATD